ncbi:MAG: hypothetical protein ACREOF_00470 [Gemmatimonadales bacterium]
MPPRQSALRPQDVAVALELALRPRQGYEPLADAVGLSLSQVHAAVKRLILARLVAPDERRVAVSTFVDFLVAGVPYAFPAGLGPETRGVPTAHSAQPLAADFSSQGAVVWPSARGTARGQSLTPLYPQAIRLPASNPPLYELLTLVDALRVGRARERQPAKELLRKRIQPGSTE